MAHCQLVADALSVPCSWVLLAEVCTAAFLAPTSVLFPTRTLPLYSMPGALILHPGATQTSGLMSTYAKVLRQIEIWQREHALQQHHARANVPPEPAGQTEDNAPPESKKPRIAAPAVMHMGFTSGSVDGVVGRLMTQLTDRLVWDKVTVKDRATVLVDAPFIGICGAAHMQELMNALGEADPLGLRERLLVMYERPCFVRSTQLIEACDRIPAPTLHSHLAKTFWPIHCAHHPGHKLATFVKDLNYSWLHHRFTPEAAMSFWSNFDDHAGQQEENYRLDQQAAKRAGKGKTRHYRLALPLRNLMQSAAGTPPQRWSTPSAGGCCEGLGPPASSPRLATWQSVFLETDDLGVVFPPAERAAILVFCQAICMCLKNPVLRQSDVGHLKPIIALNLPASCISQYTVKAFRLLDMLDLGQATLSTNVAGVKCTFFTNIPDEMVVHPIAQSSLRFFNLGTPFYTLSAAAIRQTRKKSQAEIVWKDLDDAVVAARITALLHAL
ncbi:Uncharacterized protein SCF082_LOCUS31407 [Durusdinium trenchii]|uniref:Uncharacterized protein n=1 Tax=Durusdinium trenchii TaxID=1381693 RepID=A0ABP0N5W4_9DINO